MLKLHPFIRKKLGMFKKRPYFLKNKDWYYIEKDVIGYDDYKITELGKSIPEVYNSYLEFYNIKLEEVFTNGGTDVHSEFVLNTTKKMQNDLKKKGYSNREIEKCIYEFTHIEEILSREEKEEAIKHFPELNKEFEAYYKESKQSKNKNVISQELQTDFINKNKQKNSINLEQDNSLNINEKSSSNSIINKIKSKNAARNKK